MSKLSIQVVVRPRPAKSSDGPINPDNLVITEKSVSVLRPSTGEMSHFHLDRCLGNGSSQQEVFEVVEPILEQVYRGVNATIFAYGVTGAGKTHTMQGTETSPGVIPRVVKSIFSKKSCLNTTVLNVSFSYVEILKDEVYDLLGNRAEPKKLDIRTNHAGDNVVADLTIMPVHSADEFDIVYSAAAATRKTATTNLNGNSSRSHAILTLHVESTEMGNDNKSNSGGQDLCQSYRAFRQACQLMRAQLTDLAGSENNNLTGNSQERMRESAAINKSLTTLGSVVNGLNTGASRIPYRDSKLTRILQDALGGSSLGLLLCCLAPGEKFAKDTFNTLTFAKRARKVENRAVVNERDNRPKPPPHSAAPRARSIFTVLDSSGGASATSRSANASMVSRPASRPPLLNARVNNNNLPSTMGKRNTDEGKKTSKPVIMTPELVAFINEVVDERIKQERAAMPPPPVPIKVVRPETSAGSSRSATSIDGLDEMDNEERKIRAKVLVNRARQYQKDDELEQALVNYEEALLYVPDNVKLALRIRDIQTIMEGGIPPPPPAHTSSLKRSRAPLQPLAELSREEEAADLKTTKRGRTDPSSDDDYDPDTEVKKRRAGKPVSRKATVLR
ncbi:hypothetical protein P7C73_g5472, partial [Tremellales sp. Uapishka_1]